MITADEKILLVYSWYKDAMFTIANRKIKEPSDNFHKTYQYIWFKKFLDFVEENHLNDELGRIAMFSIIKYAMQKRILNRGAAILQHKNIYNIVLKTLELDANKEDHDLISIANSNRHLSGMDHDSRVEYLLKRDRIGASRKIVNMYTSKMLSEQFLAVSKSCRIAINKLDKESTSEMPSASKLFTIQQLISMDIEKSSQIKKMLGDDCYL